MFRSGRKTELLHKAAGDGDKDTVQSLLAEGVRVDARYEDRTALHRAVVQGHDDVAALLLARGADANAAHNWGGTALHTAARQGRVALMELLLTHGADIEARNEDGRTALRFACDAENGGAVELLLAKGADTNAKDNKGIVPDTCIFSPPEGWPDRMSGWVPGQGLPSSLNALTISNRNDFRVRVGLRSQVWLGEDLLVSPGEDRSALVPNGTYKVYFQYFSDPASLYQGDDVSLSNSEAKITLAKVPQGNYNVSRVR